ncbi:hypothetical protein D3C73_990270 [compost metagenome]
MHRFAVRVEQRQGRERVVGVFIVQARQQNVAIGEHLNVAGHGFEARFELADDAALFTERQIRRAVFQQSG